MTGNQGGPSVQAFDHAAAQDLAPLEQTLAADAARSCVEFREGEEAWLRRKRHLAEESTLATLPFPAAENRLVQAVLTLKSRGLWPW